MHTDIVIRKGTPPDAPAVFSLIEEFAAFQQTPEKVTITPEQMMEEKELFQCFVAVANNREIIGFASFFFAYYSWTGKALFLDDLYIRASFRRRRVGTMLLNRVIEHARRENCKKMRWQVSRWNTGGIMFYKKLGATIDDVEINCDLYLQ